MSYRHSHHRRGRRDHGRGDYIQGNEKKDFHRAPINVTPQIPKKGTIVSGLPDAIFLRNKYQTELDNAHASVVNSVHYAEADSRMVKEAFNKAESCKRNIQAHETERVQLYTSLENLLNKETNFEEGMWKETLEKMKVRSVTVKQKFKDTDIDEIRYDAMNNFLSKYPEYTSKSTFKTLLDNIRYKEKEIREQKSFFNKMVADYNCILSKVETGIKRAEDNISIYHKILEEGQKKLSETRYVNSVFYRLASEQTKAKVTLDTLQHRIDKFTNTLNLIKSEFADTKRKSFVEMSYE